MGGWLDWCPVGDDTRNPALCKFPEGKPREIKVGLPPPDKASLPRGERGERGGDAKSPRSGLPPRVRVARATATKLALCFQTAPNSCAAMIGRSSAPHGHAPRQQNTAARKQRARGSFRPQTRQRFISPSQNTRGPALRFKRTTAKRPPFAGSVFFQHSGKHPLSSCESHTLLSAWHNTHCDTSTRLQPANEPPHNARSGLAPI